MAKRRRSRRNRRKSQLKQALKFELYGITALAFSLLALVQPGVFGQVFNGIFRFLTGSWDFLLPLVMLGLSLYVIVKRSWPKKWHYRWAGAGILCAVILILDHLSLMEAVSGYGRFENQSVLKVTWNLFLEDLSANVPLNDLGGGMVGAVLYGSLHFIFGMTGTKIIIFFLMLIGILLLLGVSFVDMMKGLRRAMLTSWAWLKHKGVEFQAMMSEADAEETADEYGQPSKSRRKRERNVVQEGQYEEIDDPGSSSDEDPQIYDFTDIAYQQGKVTYPSPEKVEAVEPQPAEVDSTLKTGDVIAYQDEGHDYHLPPFSLLKKQSRNKSIQKQDMKSKARKLEKTLESFGVNAQVTQVHRGPAVTRYEVHPAVGVKVSRIVNLADDIALALAAKGIRIEAPIPGKSAVGIEVPNEDVSMVTLREVLESASFHQSESKLSIALGRDISGEPIVAQLNKMPHLLVAGATGSGKSVCINGIIASLLYKAKPHEVKLMMIDPKMVELNVYNGIPHLLAPVVTDPKKASLALKKVVAEMERRYDLFAKSGTRDIERYNELIRAENKGAESKKPLLPYIVVIIDELADLMMVAPADVEDAIARLAQMARAAGIHLIIATQRPSVDVITGVIKANIPSRIAFGVSSQADSRTILDMGGAEKLLGRGDMLFLPVGASKTLRIQGTFIADEEVQALVAYCIKQQKAQYHEEMIPPEEEEKDGSNHVEDELYQDAVQLVIHQGYASVSMLQRRFRIGYTRAARLIDAMEENGVVGPYEGSKPREVLISKEESHIS